jgi:hypothetical protein
LMGGVGSVDISNSSPNSSCSRVVSAGALASLPHLLKTQQAAVPCNFNFGLPPYPGGFNNSNSTSRNSKGKAKRKRKPQKPGLTAKVRVGRVSAVKT